MQRIVFVTRYFKDGGQVVGVLCVVVPLEPFLPLCMELVLYQGLQAV